MALSTKWTRTELFGVRKLARLARPGRDGRLVGTWSCHICHVDGGLVNPGSIFSGAHPPALCKVISCPTNRIPGGEEFLIQG